MNGTEKDYSEWSNSGPEWQMPHVVLQTQIPASMFKLSVLNMEHKWKPEMEKGDFWERDSKEKGSVDCS